MHTVLQKTKDSSLVDVVACSFYSLFYQIIYLASGPYLLFLVMLNVVCKMV